MESCPRLIFRRLGASLALACIGVPAMLSGCSKEPPRILQMHGGEISASEVRTFTARMPASGDALIVLRQWGSDLRVHTRTGGKERVFESGTGRNGEERVVLRGTKDEDIVVEIDARRSSGALGKYEIVIEWMPETSHADRLFSAASDENDPGSAAKRSESFAQAARIYAERDRPRQAAISWLAAAFVTYETQSDIARVQGLCRAAEEALQKAPDELLLARSRELIALAQLDSPSITKVIAESIAANLDIAKGIYAGRNLQVDVAQIETHRGLLSWLTGSPDAAQNQWAAAREICAAEGDRVCEARATQNLGVLHRDANKLDLAIASLIRASSLIEESDEPILYADLNDNLGFTYRQVNDYDSALAHHAVALRVYASNARCSSASRSMYGMAYSLLGIGETGQSIQAYREVMDGRCQFLGSRGLQQEAGAFVYAGKSPVESIGPMCRAAAAIPPADFDQRLNVLSSAWDLGNVARSEGDASAARACHDLAFALADSANYRLGIQLELIDDLLLTGDQSEARRKMQEVAALLDTGTAETRTPYLARSRMLRGRLAAHDDPVQAREEMLRALKMYQDLVDWDGQFETLRQLAHLPENLVSRSEYFAKADAVLEQIRISSLDPTYRASLFAQRRQFYAEWVKLKTEQMDTDDQAALESLAISDRARSRVLRDLVDGSAHTKPNRAIAAELAHAVDAEDAAAVTHPVLDSDRSTLEKSLARLQAGLIPHDLASAADSIDDIRRKLPAKTAMLQYLLGETESYVWVVRRSGISFVKIAPAGRIREAIVGTWNLVQGGTDTDRAHAALSDLYDLLIRPIESQLGEDTELIVSPDDALYAVPFAALYERKRRRYLIEDHAVAYVPSINFASERAPSYAGRPEALLIGDPVYARTASQRCGSTQLNPPASPGLQRLRGSRVEVNQVAEILRSSGISVRELTGCDATRTQMLESLKRPLRYVHIAAHASVDPRLPYRSAVHLSPYDSNGAAISDVTVWDLLQDSLAADLVVLSACSTSGGRVFAGDGPLSLTFAMLAAGSSQVVATMWDASDAVSARVMQGFYDAMLNGHLSAPQALRASQRRLIETDQWNEPRFWATYAITGTRSTLQ